MVRVFPNILLSINSSGGGAALTRYPRYLADDVGAIVLSKSLELQVKVGYFFVSVPFCIHIDSHNY